MNILLIGVLALGAICMICGYVKGFVRIVVTLIASVATIFIVGAFSPIVTDLIIDLTPLDDAIKIKFENALFGDDIYTADAETIAESLSLSEQISLIQDSDLPEFLKESLLDNNNSVIYEQLGVSTFVDYIGSYMAKWVIGTMAYMATFIIAWIAIRMVLFSLIVISGLPLLHGINRAVGTILGLGVALVLVWVGFLGLTLIYATEIGQQCYLWIDESALLMLLYDTNPILEMLL